MKIRFFNTFEPVITFYRDLVPYLVANGYECEIVISRSVYRGGNTDLADALRHPNVKVTKIWAPFATPGAGWRKAAVILSYLVGAALYSLFARQPGLNFFLTQPPLFSVWGRLLKLLRGQRYACLLMDIYPDVAVKSGHVGAGNPLVRLSSWLVRDSWRRADAMLVIGRCMEDRLEGEGIAADRIHLLPNWIDDDAVGPLDHSENPMRAELGLKGKFVVLYSGNLGVSHTFDEVMETARRLKSRDDIRFIFIGDGSRLKEVIQAKERDGLDNVMTLPFQPFNQLRYSLNLADVHLVTLRPGFEGLVVPSKAYGALATGRPVIYVGEASGEIARMLSESGSGTVVASGDADGLGKTILDYAGDPARLAAEGAVATELTRTVYSKASAMRRYLDVFNTLAAKPLPWKKAASHAG